MTYASNKNVVTKLNLGDLTFTLDSWLTNQFYDTFLPSGANALVGSGWPGWVVEQVSVAYLGSPKQTDKNEIS